MVFGGRFRGEPPDTVILPSSAPRRGGQKLLKKNWIPAFAGMTSPLRHFVLRRRPWLRPQSRGERIESTPVGRRQRPGASAPLLIGPLQAIAAPDTGRFITVTPASEAIRAALPALNASDQFGEVQEVLFHMPFPDAPILLDLPFLVRGCCGIRPPRQVLLWLSGLQRGGCPVRFWSVARLGHDVLGCC